MSDITLSKEATEILVAKIKRYFTEELNADIGSFEAEFLIDFFAKELGPHIYNSALADVHALHSEKAEELGYLIQELEKPTG